MKQFDASIWDLQCVSFNHLFDTKIFIIASFWPFLGRRNRNRNDLQVIAMVPGRSSSSAESSVSHPKKPLLAQMKEAVERKKVQMVFFQWA